ncbi:MAG: lytic murein transglycosylase [Desulfobacterales bacterium]
MLLWMGALLLFHTPGMAGDTGLSFNDLRGRLVRDGFDANRVDKVYSRPQVVFEIEDAARFFMHNESKLNYGQFLSEQSIRSAKGYMETFKKELEKTEKALGVEKEIITAIILVETRLGVLLGNTSTLNILSTMAALSDDRLRALFWAEIPPSKRFSKKAYEEKATRKADWAYTELKAFLSVSGKENFDPVSIKGSYAGAMGIAQFMPSNILKLARDGNRDGRIDLFDHADAIMSIANYLKHYRWHKGIDKKKAYRVLLSYNHSRPYAETLLAIAERLKAAK